MWWAYSLRPMRHRQQEKKENECCKIQEAAWRRCDLKRKDEVEKRLCILSAAQREWKIRCNYGKLGVSWPIVTVLNLQTMWRPGWGWEQVAKHHLLEMVLSCQHASEILKGFLPHTSKGSGPTGASSEGLSRFWEFVFGEKSKLRTVGSFHKEI